MRITSDILKFASLTAVLSGCDNKILNGGGLTVGPTSDLNFLIIMTDQQRWDTVNASGNEIISTPNLDRLISQSAYFRQAVCPVPVSGPSRTSMLTGRLMEKTRVTTNNDVDANNCPYESYDQILSRKGYVSEYYGKFHSPLNMAYCYINPSLYGMSVPGIIKDWSKLYRYYLQDEYSAEDPEVKTLTCGFYLNVPYVPNIMDKRYDKLLSGDYTDDELQAISVSQPDCHGTLLLSPELTSNAFQAKQTLEAMERLKDRKFLLTCSFHSPHAPMLALEKYVEKYDLNTLPVPQSIGDDMTTNPYKTANGRLDNPEYSDPEKIKYMIAEYYAIISEIDYWVGEILDRLQELNLDKKTVVIFMSDHGEMLGAHGMREKNNFLEESVRVPLVIRDPSTISSPRKIDFPVSCMNVFQTIMDYAGVDAESDGFSLRPMMEGEDPEYDFAMSEWSRASRNSPNLMARTDEWKLIVNTKLNNGSYDALYNLKEDPFEMDNLLYGAPSQESRKVASELILKLIHYLEVRDYPYLEELKSKLKLYE